MEELKSLSSTQQSVACALALQMVSDGEINIIDLVREKTAAEPLVQQKVASVLDAASGLLGALKGLGGTTSSSLPFDSLPKTALGTASKILTDEKLLCRSFLKQQFGTEPSELNILGVSNPLLRNSDDDDEYRDEDDEPKEAKLTDLFPTNGSRTALLNVLRQCAQLDPAFQESTDSTIGKVIVAFG